MLAKLEVMQDDRCVRQPSTAPTRLMTAIDDFETLCVPTSAVDLVRLVRRVGTHVDRIAEAALVEPNVAVALSLELATGLRALAGKGSELSPEQRRVAGGAIAYFLLTDDADNDVSSAIGLDDDLEVFNEACRRVGRDDLVIT
jgi:hypothetical protein